MSLPTRAAEAMRMYVIASHLSGIFAIVPHMGTRANEVIGGTIALASAPKHGIVTISAYFAMLGAAAAYRPI